MTKDHPIVRFYIMRYKNGKTRIPKKYEEAVMKAILEEEEVEKIEKENMKI